MSEIHAKGVTVTFTPIYNGKFMFVQRQLHDEMLAGYWCFPGGRVHVGETLAGALVRELKEETSLEPTGRVFFVDSFLIGDRVGAHFAVEVTHDQPTLQELHDHAWVESVAELAAFAPRIPGIDTHLHMIVERLEAFKKLAHLSPEIHDLGWQQLADYDLVKRRFINR